MSTRHDSVPALIGPGFSLVHARIALVWLLLGSMLSFFPSPAHCLPAIRPQEIPSALAKRGKKVSALKAVINVSTTYEKEKSLQNVKGFLLYRRPMDFRFQGMGPAGNSLFELVFKGNRFDLFVPSDGKVLTGNKECFGRRFPDIAELQALIPLALLQWRDVRFQREISSKGDRSVLRLSFRGDIWEASVDTKKLLVTRLARLDSQGPDLVADFADFGAASLKWLPRRFRVRSRSGGWLTVVKIPRIKVNPFLVEKNFKLELTHSPAVEKCR